MYRKYTDIFITTNRTEVGTDFCQAHVAGHE